MDAVQMPTCCGLTLLRNFGNTSTAIDGTNYTIEQVDNFLKNFTYGNFQVNLNTPQFKLLGDTFKANGFKVIAQFYYNGHGNDIYILIKARSKQDQIEVTRVGICKHTKKPIIQIRDVASNDAEDERGWLCCHKDTRKEEVKDIKQFLKQQK